jgi:hypothetical protein
MLAEQFTAAAAAARNTAAVDEIARLTGALMPNVN